MARTFKVKKKKGMETAPPARPATHEIDTMAVRFVERAFSANLIRRDLQDRDYGMDMLVEVFNGQQPTGTLMLLQIKGHAASSASPVVMQVPVKTLLYARMFGAPFFLITVSLEDEKAHYVWLQKYIATRLPIDSPKWQTQEKVNITFPIENLLDSDGLRRMTALADQHARRSVGQQFLYHFSWLRRHFDEYRTGFSDGIQAAVEHASKLTELSDFADFYAEFVDAFDLDSVHRVIQKAAQYRGLPLDDDDDNFIDEQFSALDQLQNLFLSGDEIEQFIIENDKDHAPY